ncbi:MAG: cysteine hydrolase family protein [Bacteroidota bacterium]
MTSVLLLIDIQNEYFENGKMPLSGTKKAAANAAILAAHFREKTYPVIHIRHDEGPDSEVFGSKTEGGKINDMVKPLKDETVIAKNQINAFRDTNLEDELRKHNPSRIVVAGNMTHMCVDSAVRAAADLGFDVTVVADACATKDLTFQEQTVKAADVHAAFLAALAGGGFAKVQSTQEFMSDENFNQATA